MTRQTSYRSATTGKKQVVGWNLFAQFVKNLSHDIGHIHHPQKKHWTKSRNKNVHGGVQKVNVHLGIGAKSQEQSWDLFDGNDDEYPWDFLGGLAWGGEEWLPKANDIKFRELLSEASVKLLRAQSGGKYVLTFFFKPVMFGYENRDFMEFKITVGTHHSIDPKRKAMSRAEGERALNVAKRLLKEFQKKTALGPPGGSSITVGVEYAGGSAVRESGRGKGKGGRKS